MCQTGDQLSAPTPASADVGAVPGGTLLLDGAAISWKCKQQQDVSAAADIDERCTRKQSEDMTASATKQCLQTRVVSCS